MRPYYQCKGITLYHGDALDLLPVMEPVDVIITDPVWPDCERIFPGIDATAVFADAAKHFPRLCRRLIVQLGMMSDPRFLAGIPDDLPFSRACWLKYIVPAYHGTILRSADLAYVFGENYRCGKGKRVMPSECPMTTPESGLRRSIDHPCPRHPGHVAWLIKNYTRPEDLVLDPFAGAGTTLVEAARAGRQAIGIEISEEYCAVIKRRLQALHAGVPHHQFVAGQRGLF